MNTGIVEKKVHKQDFEVGSGSLSIPILGDLFPNLWGQQMKPIDKWVLVIKNVTYMVDKELYDNVMEGDSVEIYIKSGFPEIKLCYGK